MSDEVNKAMQDPERAKRINDEYLNLMKAELELAHERIKELEEQIETYGLGHHKDCNNRYDNKLLCNCKDLTTKVGKKHDE